MSGSSCRCCMFVSCVHPVEVLVNLQIGRVVSTQFAQQFESAVTAPPFVDCVIWNYYLSTDGTFNIILFYWCSLFVGTIQNEPESMVYLTIMLVQI